LDEVVFTFVVDPGAFISGLPSNCLSSEVILSFESVFGFALSLLSGFAFSLSFD
jgi:hypothetical protein